MDQHASIASSLGGNPPLGHEMTKGSEFRLTDQDFRKISELVHKLTGIVLKEEKKVLVYSRLAKRLRTLKMQTFKEYCQFLEGPSGKEEMTSFINALTTNLTRFFREMHHFDHMKNVVIPYIIERYQRELTTNAKRVRIWSAGCSSGEEPYSIAMVLASHLPAGFDVKILATDIDTNMLSTGKKGLYQSIQGVPPEYMHFCQKQPQGGYMMASQLMQMITFNPLNLLHNWPMRGDFQAIFCRNVVIYFNKDTQAHIFNRMEPLLEADGWLFIGHSESLFKVCDQFQLKGQTIYQKETNT